MGNLLSTAVRQLPEQHEGVIFRIVAVLQPRQYSATLSIRRSVVRCRARTLNDFAARIISSTKLEAAVPCRTAETSQEFLSPFPQRTNKSRLNRRRLRTFPPSINAYGVITLPAD